MSKRIGKSVKKGGNTISLPLNIAKGTALGWIIFVALLALFSLIILKSEINHSLFFLFVLGASMVSVMVGCMFVSKKAVGKKLPLGMVCCLILLITEFILLLCFNNTALSNKIYLIFPCDIVFGFIGCIIGANIRK